MKSLNRLIAGTLLLSSSVLAQPAPPSTAGGPASAPPAAAPGAVPAADVDISVGQKPTLTVDEMISQSRQYQQSMGQVLSHIQSLQETARKQKDIIKLNCVSDKLVQAKVNASIADQAMTALQENISTHHHQPKSHRPRRRGRELHRRGPDLRRVNQNRCRR